MTAQLRKRSGGEEGFLLLWLVVVTFLLLLAIGIAAPRMAKELERDREVESAHRAQQYVRAIKLYYDKNGKTFPTTIEQLEKTGDRRYLRKHYLDPLTGGEFRLIPFGQAKTEVKGFFGEPLQGSAPGSLGTLAGQASSFGTSGAPGTGGVGSNTPSSFGGGSTGGFSLGGGGSSTGGAAAGGSAPTGPIVTGQPGEPGAPGAATPKATGSTLSGTNATDFKGGGPPFVGVGSSKKGTGLIEVNGSTEISDWEFLYDPRVEILKAKVNTLGGAASGGGGSLGSNSASTFGAPAGGGNGTTGTGSGSPGAGTNSGATPVPAPVGNQPQP